MDSLEGMEPSTSRDFASYLQTMVDLDILDRMTTSLSQELADAKRVTADIGSMLDDLSQHANVNEAELEYLEAGIPNLLLPDMVTVDMDADVDVESMIASMRRCTEEMKKNIVISPPPPKVASYEILSLELKPYVLNLDRLSKLLGNKQLNKKHDGDRDLVLENKLGQLCKDVDVLTQMVLTNTKILETTENWKESQLDGSVWQYQELINKLLSGINEVTYLLQHRD